MKIACECGAVVIDQTDYLSYKAHLISDQDWFDFLDTIDKAIEKSGPTPREKESALMNVRNLARELTKSVYQCTKCGSLYIENHQNELELFVKIEQFEGQSILSSAYGANWKRTLIGDWNDIRNEAVKGYLWGIDIKDINFESWEELEGKYYLIFEDWKKRNILRSALLKRNYEVIHSWNMEVE